MLSNAYRSNFEETGKELFKAEKRETAVNTVINTIKNLLITKRLIPGDRLPSETELSKSLELSRGSIREAMKILSAIGVVEIRQGDGTYIAKSVNNVLFDPLMFSLIASNADERELTEFRELMEQQIIRLVIKNADEDNLSAIQEIYTTMEMTVNSRKASPEQLAQYDMNYHKAMGHATKNVLVEKIYNFVLDFFEPSIIKTHEVQENGLAALANHKKMLDAILERNIEKAIQAVQDSIKAWQSLF